MQLHAANLANLELRVSTCLHSPADRAGALSHDTRPGCGAQLGWPDMRLPILYTMSWPERMPCSEQTWPRLDFMKMGDLTFKEPDRQKYPAMDVAYAAGRAGGTMTGVLSAANEQVGSAVQVRGRRCPAAACSIRQPRDKHTTLAQTTQSTAALDSWRCRARKLIFMV